jgi:hypothetical protein
VELIMGKLLNKSAILSADDLKHEDVDVPSWGGTVRVRELTGQERDEFRAAIASDEGVPLGKFSAALLAACCIGEDGARLFSMDDIAVLAAKNASALDAPAAAAMRLNGLGGNSIEDAVKNSLSGQSDDSGSGSPSSLDALSESSKAG